MTCNHQRMPSEPDWIKLSGYNPAHARVHFSAVREPYALALIDSNSDGREIALIVLARKEGKEWADDDALEDETSLDDVGDEGNGWAWSFVWAYGRAEPRSEITVIYRDELHEVSTNNAGWWVFVHPAGPNADDTFTAPTRIE